MDLIKNLFTSFLNYVPSERSQSLDLDNILFHRQNELRIKFPKSWDCSDGIIKALADWHKSNTHLQNVCVLYSDAPCYSLFSKKYEAEIKPAPVYCSFYELECAIRQSSFDVRPQQYITKNIADSAVVLVLDSSRCFDAALSAIRQFTNGSLILID